MAGLSLQQIATRSQTSRIQTGKNWYLCIIKSKSIGNYLASFSAEKEKDSCNAGQMNTFFVAKFSEKKSTSNREKKLVTTWCSLWPSSDGCFLCVRVYVAVKRMVDRITGLGQPRFRVPDCNQLVHPGSAILFPLIWS